MKERQTFKKAIVALSLAALALTATPVFAHEGGQVGAKIEAAFNHGWHFGQNKFAVSGTVVSASSTSLVINKYDNTQAAIVLNSDTKINGNDKNVLTWSDLKAGDKVVATGSVSGSTLTAVRVRDMSRPVVKASGKVTAKTDSSITITNGLTGVSTMVTTNADTKVRIDGETKTAGDIAVGDSGWVRFKTEAGVMVAKFINLFR